MSGEKRKLTLHNICCIFNFNSEPQEELVQMVILFLNGIRTMTQDSTTKEVEQQQSRIVSALTLNVTNIRLTASTVEVAVEAQLP